MRASLGRYDAERIGPHRRAMPPGGGAAARLLGRRPRSASRWLSGSRSCVVARDRVPGLIAVRSRRTLAQARRSSSCSTTGVHGGRSRGGAARAAQPDRMAAHRGGWRSRSAATARLRVPRLRDPTTERCRSVPWRCSSSPAWIYAFMLAAADHPALPRGSASDRAGDGRCVPTCARRRHRRRHAWSPSPTFSLRIPVDGSGNLIGLNHPRGAAPGLAVQASPRRRSSCSSARGRRRTRSSLPPRGRRAPPAAEVARRRRRDLRRRARRHGRVDQRPGVRRQRPARRRARRAAAQHRRRDPPLPAV